MFIFFGCKITRRQALSLIREWEELDLGADLHEVLWAEVNQVFLEQHFPPLQACIFFIQQATALQGMAKDKELQRLLLEALAWVQGTKDNSGPTEAPTLVTDLKRTLFLMDAEAKALEEVSGNKVSPVQCHLVL